MKHLFLIAISSALLLSCKNNTETPVQEKSIAVEKVQSEEVNSDELTLNNSEKWAVNEEMKPHVLKGEELVNSYLQTNNADYVALAEQLKAQNDQLIKSCTMDGASHDELHKWLHPHLELVGTLATSKDENKAKEVVQHISTSYETYHQYFN